MALPLHQEEFMDGREAAALIAAGVGILALGLVMPVGAWLVTVVGAPCEWTRPVLSALALTIWGGTWMGLRWRWRGRAQPARRIVFVMGGLVLLGLLVGSPLLVVFWRGAMLP